MKLPLSEFEKLNDYNKYGSIKEQGKYLYKSPRMATEKHLLLLLRFIPKHKGLVLPTRLLRNSSGDIYGYQMPKIPNSQNLDQYLTNPQIETDILRSIDQLFKLLKIVHRYLIIGDIRNSNILLTTEQAYICDFDFSYPKKEINLYNPLTYYDLCFNTYFKFYNQSQLTDTIKMLISCLSLYYESNLETLITKGYINFDELYELLESIKASKYILDYCQSLLNDAQNNQIKASTSFREYIPYLALPSTKEKELLRKRISSKKG